MRFDEFCYIGAFKKPTPGNQVFGVWTTAKPEYTINGKPSSELHANTNMIMCIFQVNGKDS